MATAAASLTGPRSPTLRVPGDRPSEAPFLGDWIAGAAPDVAAIVKAFARAVPGLASRLATGCLAGDPARIVGRNTAGDAQKALDLAAHDWVLSYLADAPVRYVLSEEADDPILIDPEASLDVTMDPIDGSGSIGLGLPLGLFFLIVPSRPTPFTAPCRDAVAAGYVMFGHSVEMGLTLGDGVALATLDPANQAFRVVRENVRIPAGGPIAYNAANERFWGPALRIWAEGIRAGGTGPRGRDANMRWLAAAVGELHRVLLTGGAFLYPADMRPGYEAGHLRLLYEAAPIAFLIEQAGGRASDGHGPVLDRVPGTYHARTPLIFGEPAEVEHIETALGGRSSSGRADAG